MKKYSAIITVLLAGILCISTMATYFHRTLDGNLNGHILSSEMFGIPESLELKGIKPLFKGEKHTGWDGQFYYYMSNDLLGIKDTPSHIDSPSYRYQRIGLSLYAATVATLMGQDWVSPNLYYFSYLGLILLATFTLANLLKNAGSYALLALLWTAGVGTQVTLLNGLPDAAADAFLILATWAILSSRHWFGASLLMMAALSRESYIIFSACYFSFLWWTEVKNIALNSWLKTTIISLKKPKILSLIFLFIIFLSWQLYIRLHFNIAPSDQANGILGFPLHEWWIAIKSGFSGNHYLVASGLPSYFEGFAQLCFIVLLILTLFLSIKFLINQTSNDSWINSLAIASIFIVFLYACFGRTVAMHYTGYLKAANLFLFLILILTPKTITKNSLKFAVYFVLISVVSFSNVYLWKDKILARPEISSFEYTRVNEVTEINKLACFDSYDVDIELIRIEDLISSYPKWWPFNNYKRVYWIDLTNNTGNDFKSFHGVGSVNMSYHFLNKENPLKTIDGFRSMVPEGIKNGETVRIPVFVSIPDDVENYILKLSPVQEGCSWFYHANPESGLDVHNGFKV